MTKIAKSILKKIGEDDIIEKLTEKLSLSELNSLLLEILRKASEKISPAELMRNYEKNRFVSFSSYDPVAFKEDEISLLKLAKESGFMPMELSPVSPLGTCSAIATVDQNKILSAVRGTEVVADATNVLALECSRKRKKSNFDNSIIHLCTIHKHIRAQSIGNTPGFTQHFKIFCAVSSGKDAGDFQFEKQSLLKHLSLYEKYLKEELRIPNLTVRFKALSGKDKNRLCISVSEFIESQLKSFQYEKIEVAQSEQQYYQQLQFKILLRVNGNEFDIGDGGFVDWTQKLTGNNKERFLISALGNELLYKIINNAL